MSEVIIDSIQKCNIVLVNSGVIKDQSHVKNIKYIFNDLLKNKNIGIDSITEVKGINGAKLACRNDKKNILIVPSENEVFIVDFLTQLYSFSMKEKNNIQVAGLRKWFQLDNLDIEYLNHFNVFYPTFGQVDYNNNNIKSLLIEYRKKYNTDPGEYFFTSYAAGLCLFSKLINEGTGFLNRIDKHVYQNEISDFNFFRPNHNTGFENKGVQIWQYKDYTYQKVR
jgi:hypothetical protein